MNRTEINATTTALLICAMLLTGCASSKISPEPIFPNEPLSSEMREVGTQDKYGRTVFGDIIKDAPHKSGDTHVILQRDAQGRPRVSYLIAIVDNEADATEPFKVLFDWTGKGFKAAGNFLKTLLTADVQISDDDAAMAYMAFTAAGTIVVIAGGIMIGVADGSWQAGKEIGKVFTDKEIIASFTTFEHDDEDRLIRSRVWFAGTPATEIIRSTFFYDKDSATPHGAIMQSIPDDIKYELEF